MRNSSVARQFEMAYDFENMLAAKRCNKTHSAALQHSMIPTNPILAHQEKLGMNAGKLKKKCRL